MIALGIRYLTKYAVATNLARQQAEWPPHPGRVFMAMVSSHFEAGADPAERAALEWLESAPAPALSASDADERTIVRTYVPVNDEHKGIMGRSRQDRAFPRTRPHDDCVYLIWPAEPAAETRVALAGLCSKVTRVGHSMSAVQMWVVPPGKEPAPNWLPDMRGRDARLRVTESGTLQSLERTFHANGQKRPQLDRWQGYGRASAASDELPVAEGPFEEAFLVLTKTDGPALGLESTLQLTAALRNWALKPAGKESPEWLSGHDAADLPSRNPHLAFFPLPYVGFEYADGHVLGLGIAIPRNFELTRGASRDEEIRTFLGPLLFDPETGDEREITLWNKGVWRWTLEREKRERPPLTLQLLNWTKPSRTWASVTPMVLHHHPKKREGDLERIVKEAFASALLPQPESVRIGSVSAVQGAGHAMGMPLFTEGGAALCRYQTHVTARFAQPVRGPMLVGRGRYRGYGLFRPVAEGEV